MKVIVTTVGVMNRQHKVEWPEGWPIPREGDDVTIPELPEVDCVRTLVWYPQGDIDDPEPSVYIVLGPRRRVY